MYARVTMFEDLDLAMSEKFMAWAKEDGLRLSRQLPGYQGLLTLVDRENRRLVGIGLYDTRENRSGGGSDDGRGAAGVDAGGAAERDSEEDVRGCVRGGGHRRPACTVKLT